MNATDIPASGPLQHPGRVALCHLAGLAALSTELPESIAIIRLLFWLHGAPAPPQVSPGDSRDDLLRLDPASRAAFFMVLDWFASASDREPLATTCRQIGEHLKNLHHAR